MPLTAKSTLREVLAGTETTAILDKHLPGASSHPLLSQGLDMTLEAITAVPEAGLTAKRLMAMVAGFARLEKDRETAAAAAAAEQE